MYNVCKYKTAINVHYYLPFLSTVSMSLGMSIIMSVVNSEIKWKRVIYIYIFIIKELQQLSGADPGWGGGGGAHPARAPP